MCGKTANGFEFITRMGYHRQKIGEISPKIAVLSYRVAGRAPKTRGTFLPEVMAFDTAGIGEWVGTMPEMVNTPERLNKVILKKVKRFDCKTFLVNTF